MWEMFSLLLFLGCIGRGLTQCPDNWVNFQGQCYLFSHDVKTFTEAEDFCVQRGSHLAHVYSSMESMFLRNMCRDLVRNDHWIGLTDADIEGVWRWKHNGQLPNYTDWFPGEPNGASRQNCVVLYPDNDYRWEDMECSKKKGLPICQKPFTYSNGGANIVG